jgi:hypothetical protein
MAGLWAHLSALKYRTRRTSWSILPTVLQTLAQNVTLHRYEQCGTMGLWTWSSEAPGPPWHIHLPRAAALGKAVSSRKIAVEQHIKKPTGGVPMFVVGAVVGRISTSTGGAGHALVDLTGQCKARIQGTICSC